MAAARLPNQPANLTLLTVHELILRYPQFARTYYSKAGQPAKELADMKYALRPVRKLYGRSLVREFGPLALKAVRQHMIDVEDLSRGVINNRINRVKRVFKWAVSEELAPAGAYEALRAVVGLRYGRNSGNRCAATTCGIEMRMVWKRAVFGEGGAGRVARAVRDSRCRWPCVTDSSRLNSGRIRAACLNRREQQNRAAARQRA